MFEAITFWVIVAWFAIGLWMVMASLFPSGTQAAALPPTQWPANGQADATAWRPSLSPLEQADGTCFPTPAVGVDAEPCNACDTPSP